MSTYNRHYVDDESNEFDPSILREVGPIIPVHILPTEALRVALEKQGVTILPVQGDALIDTGASASVVDENALLTLRIKPTGKKKLLQTLNQESMEDNFAVQFSFPETTLPDLDFNSVFSSTNLKAQNLVAILGRDILQHAVFIYHGNGHFTLALDPNQKIEKGLLKMEDGAKVLPIVKKVRGEKGKKKEEIDW